MGQKVHPLSLRLNFIKDWNSRWFAKRKDYSNNLFEDIKIRKYIKKNFSSASVARIEIERSSNRIRIIVSSGRPGVIIGRRGADIDRLRDELQSMTRKEIYVDIKEIAAPMADAQLVAENIAFQLEKRVAFRRAMKKAVSQAMSSGAEGIKIICSGRLGGAEIARSEKYKAGKIPLHTLRADVDYGFAEAHTTYGVIGVKCWVYKGDVILGKKNQEELKAVGTESEAK
ncbi:MAG: 30S ribosomal protein S3 [Candidatus Omnitrophica bacterium]|nr:30S ribosomal protein S3 [Candidatus Omnitrophota bacterium]MBU1924855.1 30S ribosomal protein S3 [Candidatus Omnitrophota bacterium]